MTESGNENLDGQGGGLGRRRKVGTRTWKGRAEDWEGDGRKGDEEKRGRKEQGFARKLIPWLCTPERSSPAAARVWFVFCEHQSIGRNVP